MNSKKWDSHYQTSSQIPDATAVLVENAHLLPQSGQALDLACGLGANALLLAQSELAVHGWDISDVALKKLSATAQQQQVTIHTLCRDVEQNPPDEKSFDVIVVSHFLYRPICKALSQALKPGGLLFYQTFCQEKVLAGGGPSNSKFLLQEQELLILFSELQVLHYKEERDSGDLQLGLRNQAYLVARKTINNN